MYRTAFYDVSLLVVGHDPGWSLDLEGDSFLRHQPVGRLRGYKIINRITILHQIPSQPFGFK